MSDDLYVNGVSRSPVSDREICVHFNRELTSDELRAFHEHLRRAPVAQAKPVAWRYWKDKFNCYSYSEEKPDVQERYELEPLYASPVEPQWRPIETAPQGGRELILLLTPSGFPQVAYSNSWWRSGFSVECKPSHWMPLPAPPQTAAGKAE